MSGLSPGPFRRRLAKKLDEAGFASLTQRDVAAIQRAFVEALREEVEARFPAVAFEDAVGQSLQRVMTPNFQTPLVIPGLGSFKMKTRPAREFTTPANAGVVDKHEDGVVRKPPARRLAFTSKWEEIK